MPEVNWIGTHKCCEFSIPCCMALVLSRALAGLEGCSIHAMVAAMLVWGSHTGLLEGLYPCILHYHRHGSCPVSLGKPYRAAGVLVLYGEDKLTNVRK